ncbi:MAG: penicillin acylase family protein [Actinomycetota bacterium]|nr:penicillin acylase family protein [Actinomycetota bacterium]
MRRSLALTALLLLAAVPTASAADYADTALNILPSGQYQLPGEAADDQAVMYNALTPRYDNVSDGDLSTFFKSEALGPATVVSEETIPGRPGVVIRRDDFNVPHVFGQTNDDVIFGAGWVMAADRNLLLNQGRFNGLLAAIDAPNVSAIDLIRNLYQFAPSKKTNSIVARQTKVLQAAGERGAQLLHDIDVYLAGINAWYAANSPASPKFTRNDVYAFNAIKGQFLGEGGGAEPQASQFLDGLQRRFGAKRGFAMWQDLRNRKDPEQVPTTDSAKKYDTATGSRRGTVTLRNGTFKRQGGIGSAGAPRAEASNILILSGQRSASGRPLFVGGPQIGYFFPGLTMEIGMYGPDIQVRGATAPPFPGYLLIGRGEDFAVTLTSAGGDIVDTYAETLCGGSRAKYLYRGRCRNMETVDAGTLTKGETKTKVRFRQTVHGPVIGYARTAGGREVAITRKRSSYGKDTLDQLFFRDLTFGRIRSFADFTASASQTPQTFNAFYADHQNSGVYMTGLLPLRPKGADGSLVNDGRGGYEWRGFLKASGHPSQSNPPSGMIVNWNNRIGRNFVSGDDRFGSEGPLQRNNMLLNEVARTEKHTLGSVVAAMNAGAVQDVRGYLFWPTLKKMLAKAASPSDLATQMAAQLDAWNARRAPRIDQDGDGNLDDAGVPIMDGIWPRLTTAGLCDTLAPALCKQFDGTLHGRFSAPPGGGQYSGWHHYMDKDLRTLLGESVKGKFSRRYCAATAAACAKKLWAAIDAAGQSLAQSLGPDPAQWRESRSENLIKFGPLPLIDMDYTNRPSGIQQVISFNGHR